MCGDTKVIFMKRSCFNKTVRQITNRLLPNIRRFGAITALVLGIGMAATGAVGRSMFPAPTRAEKKQGIMIC